MARFPTAQEFFGRTRASLIALTVPFLGLGVLALIRGTQAVGAGHLTHTAGSSNYELAWQGTTHVISRDRYMQLQAQSSGLGAGVCLVFATIALLVIGAYLFPRAAVAEEGDMQQV